jgi:hypothetical protein
MNWTLGMWLPRGRLQLDGRNLSSSGDSGLRTGEKRFCSDKMVRSGRFGIDARDAFSRLKSRRDPMVSDWKLPRREWVAKPSQRGRNSDDHRLTAREPAAFLGGPLPRGYGSVTAEASLSRALQGVRQDVTAPQHPRCYKLALGK